ncbi:XRN 5'-3' exonuclease N-terminus-domain-containing protein [Coemansia spiralis]|nr:XRN 5'-3' exonuclease N-terminus-domain-containing protein [Coemansia spiralis]
MGVAAFYRWLTRKYPKVQSRVIEEKSGNINGIEIPVDATKPNPNGVEFDNLYLDMNGIVHPCCHPSFKEAPETEEDMMIEVFKCLDRVFNMIRPRKLVYMALDGVAPRAKMNQQRSRRFRAAQEAEEKEREQEKLAEEIFQATGEKQPIPQKPWDSNSITPGTPFMELLAKSLRYYVVLKLNTDPAWKTVKVILSDSNVPGEGEHKIMDYIRRQRMTPAYNPNTSHVLYGLDADLIMLSLATHEPYFRILREDVTWADMLAKPCRKCGKKGHFERDCGGKNHPAPDVDPSTQPFVFAHIDILREYLEYELEPKGPLPSPFNLERAIDDWVFLCFFVGNDFLPHLPSLEIREGAIEKLVEFWKEELTSSGGYITNSGEVDLFRVQPIMDKIGALEEKTFKDRNRQELERERRQQRDKARSERNEENRIEEAAEQMAAVAAANARKQREIAVDEQRKASAKNFTAANDLKARLAAKKLQGPEPTVASLPGDEDVEEDEIMATGTTTILSTAHKRTHSEAEEDEKEGGDYNNNSEPELQKDAMLVDGVMDDETELPTKRARVDEQQESASESQGDSRAEINDDQSTSAIDNDNESEASEAVDPMADQVKFHESGYKQRYYSLKFHISEDDKEEINNIVEHYVCGLCWVLKYYYQGCVSWGWYYPYHYAPLASDFTDLDVMDISFELGSPLRPYEQLMGVLPARSRHNLPKEFSPLMTEVTSPIIDFYPTDFPLDLNGKKFLWQAVILLPFIDQARLLDAVEKVYPRLSPKQIERNERGSELLIVGNANPLYDSLCDIYTTGDPEKKTRLNPKLSGRFSGSVSCNPNYIPHTTYESPLQEVDKPDIENDSSISVIYYHPQTDSSHMCALLPGLAKPRRTLSMADKEFVRTGGKSGFRGPPRTTQYENFRDNSHFYRQRGNDVSQDRGRGPRRYDEQGNENPEYHQYYSSNRGRPQYPHRSHQRPPPPNRPYTHPANHGYSNYHGSNRPMPPQPPRPMAYQPFAGRRATPISAPNVPNPNSRGGYRDGHRDGHRDSHRGGSNGNNNGNWRRGGGSGGGYRGGYRGGYQHGRNGN